MFNYKNKKKILLYFQKLKKKNILKLLNLSHHNTKNVMPHQEFR